MRLPIVIEDPDERERRQREEDEERVLDQDQRWDEEDRAGLGAWAHRVARRERTRRARHDHESELP
jgi:hypothetical protein